MFTRDGHAISVRKPVWFLTFTVFHRLEFSLSLRFIAIILFVATAAIGWVRRKAVDK
ncbi:MULTISPECIES: hypothetical protein [Arthrobacter]|uniref:hypothetical protein n=1 Tax=Arthrobacter TaxID=1663 RepID=UPI000AE9481E|nr:MULTISPECIES: hypothetical protein [Arthrobacter]